MIKKFIALVTVPIALLFSCGNDDAGSTSTKVKQLPTYRVVKKDTIVSSTFVADIHAKKNVEIHARIAGLLEGVLVNEGQSVKKGQLLFKLNDAELQIELLKAQATLKTAQAELRMASVELKQMQTLFDKKVIADNELEMTKAKHEAAEAKVSYASAEKHAITQQISFTEIKSPFEGVVDRIPLKEGSLIQNGTLLTTVSELDEIFAYFSLPETYYFQLLADNKIGSHRDIQLFLPDGSKYNFDGELETADADIDRQTGSIQYKVKFKNPNRLIKHGTSGKLIISEERKKALLVPLKSVFSIQDKRYVFVLQKNGTVKMRSIVLGGTLEGSYIVDAGLKEGEFIISEGTQSLRDGEKVKAKKVAN